MGFSIGSDSLRDRQGGAILICKQVGISLAALSFEVIGKIGLSGSGYLDSRILGWASAKFLLIS
jgi:hypothetical protein